MPTQSLTFLGGQGATLSARLELPDSGAPTSCAVFAHCFTCSKDSKAAVIISRSLAALGMAVLRFDFTGLGASDGEFSSTTYSGSVLDIVAAARFMGAMLHPPTLLIGHSLGGAAVLRAAGELSDVRAVVTLGAPSEPSHVARLFASATSAIEENGSAPVVIDNRSFNISRTLLDDLREASLLDAVSGLGRALLVMHAPGDSIVSVDHAARLYSAAKHPKSFVSLDDADHLLSRASDARYAAAVLSAWASRYVRQVGPAGAANAAAGERTPERAQVRATTTATGGFRTDLLVRDHALLADEPRPAGGTDAGPSPYDLLSASLATCTSMTLQQYAHRKEWPLERAVVRVTHAQHASVDASGARPLRTDVMIRELELVGPLDETQRRRLLEIAERCPVHRTLTNGLVVTTSLRESNAGPDGLDGSVGIGNQ